MYLLRTARQKLLFSEKRYVGEPRTDAWVASVWKPNATLSAPTEFVGHTDQLRFSDRRAIEFHGPPFFAASLVGDLDAIRLFA